jgi:hypothetical protein
VIHSDKNVLASFASSDLFGVNKLKESSAFQKITKVSKAEHLSLVNSLGQPKNANLIYDNLYYTEGDLQKTRTYSLKRQQNFLKLQNTNTALKTHFDQKSFGKLVNFKALDPSTNESEQNFSLKTSARFSAKSLPEIFYNERNRLSSPSSLTKDVLVGSSKTPKPADSAYTGYVIFKNSAIQKFANNASNFTYPSAKPLTGVFQKKSTTLTSPFNIYSNARINSTNKSFLSSEQTVKQIQNLSNEIQSKGSYLIDHIAANPLSSPLLTSLRGGSLKGFPLQHATTNLLFELPVSPVASTTPRVEAINYDLATTLRTEILTSPKHTFVYNTQAYSDNIQLLQGKRDGAPQFLSSTY